MKKSKFTLLILLFSLFLNIGHDLVIYEESKDSCSTTMQLVDQNIENNCCSQIEELHNAFHFVAILPTQSLTFISSELNPSIYHSYATSSVPNNSFKPPRT